MAGPRSPGALVAAIVARSSSDSSCGPNPPLSTATAIRHRYGPNGWPEIKPSRAWRAADFSAATVLARSNPGLWLDCLVVFVARGFARRTAGRAERTAEKSDASVTNAAFRAPSPMAPKCWRKASILRNNSRAVGTGFGLRGDGLGGFGSLASANMLRSSHSSAGYAKTVNERKVLAPLNRRKELDRKSLMFNGIRERRSSAQGDCKWFPRFGLGRFVAFCFDMGDLTQQ
jgi:hypothetical protein